MTTPNITATDFQPAPPGFDQSGTTTRCAIATTADGKQVIITDGADGVTIAADTGNHNWISSSDPNDWPELNNQVGNWQQLIADWTDETQ